MLSELISCKILQKLLYVEAPINIKKFEINDASIKIDPIVIAIFASFLY